MTRVEELKTLTSFELDSLATTLERIIEESDLAQTWAYYGRESMKELALVRFEQYRRRHEQQLVGGIGSHQEVRPYPVRDLQKER